MILKNTEQQSFFYIYIFLISLFLSIISADVKVEYFQNKNLRLMYEDKTVVLFLLDQPVH